MSEKTAKIIFIICVIFGLLNIILQWISNDTEPLFKVIGVLGGFFSCAIGLFGLKVLRDKRNKQK